MKKFPKLKSKAILSPMAGVTDVAFRALAKKYGAGITYTEFLSGSAIVRKNKKTLEMLKVDEIEKPVGVQLFGSSIIEVIEAAKIIENNFDIIDINCGCPAWKVIRSGAGSEMLKKPDEIYKFICNLVDNVNKPVTVKIRSGIDEKNINAVEIAKLVEEAGASAVAIHARTQKQGYSGKSDWELIKKVKNTVNIPVIGNGDVFNPEDFKKRLEESNVDGIMIARGAMSNPYIFKQINDHMRNNRYDFKNKLEQFSEYLKLAEKHKIKFILIKNHAINFTKGIENGAKLREKLVRCKDMTVIKAILAKRQKSIALEA